MLAILVGQHALTIVGHPEYLVPLGVIGVALVAVVSYLLPDRWIFPAPFRQAYSPRFAGVVRMAYYTGLLVLMGLAR